MGIFTLRELETLPIERIYLAHVNHLNQEKDPLDVVLFQQMIIQLEKQQEYQQKKLSNSIFAKEKSKIAYDRKRFELLVCDQLEATIIYQEENGSYINLIQNEALKETDQILADSLYPISFYLTEEAPSLVYETVYSYVPFEIVDRLNDKRLSYFDKETQTYQSGNLLKLYHQSFQRAFWIQIGQETDFTCFSEKVICPNSDQAEQSNIKRKTDVFSKQRESRENKCKSLKI